MIKFFDVSKQAEYVFDNKTKKIINDIISTGSYSDDKYLIDFERKFAEYMGCTYAVGVNSIISSFILALKALNISNGDEVIVPAVSPFYIPFSVNHVNAKPVFADVSNFNNFINTESVISKITVNTKAIIVTHLYGYPGPVDVLKEELAGKNIYIIEDCCISLGSSIRKDNKWFKTGTFGDIGIFGFKQDSNVSCISNCGILITDNKGIYESVNSHRNKGKVNNDDYDFTNIGYDYKPDAVTAVYMMSLLDKVAVINTNLKQIANYYNFMFVDLFGKTKNSLDTYFSVPFYLDEFENPVYNMYVIKFREEFINYRQRFIDFLNKKNIQTTVPYRLPCHLFKVYNILGYNYNSGDFPEAEYITDSCVSLPIYYGMTYDTVVHIYNTIAGFFINEVENV